MKMFDKNQLFHLLRSITLEMIREPEVLFWGIIFPVLLSIGLGLAFMQGADTKFHILTVTQNSGKIDTILSQYATDGKYKGNTSKVWKINDKILGNTEFNFTKSDWPSSIISLKRGEADLIIADSIGHLRYHFDPHNSQAQLAYMKLSALLKSPENHETESVKEVAPLELKGVRYIDFLIPGLITFGIMGSIMWGISYTIIERRSQKLLRRMVATPMRKTNFLIALMGVRTLMNLIETLILFFFAYLIFDIEIQGNIGALLVLFLAGNLAFTGIAILVSCRTSKTEVGTGLINAVQMPMMLLSGIFFSYHNFPDWSIGIIKLLPLTAFTDGIRSIFNEGAGWMEIITPAAALSILGILCFIIGMKRFKWY
jgi:ABC-type multidrug transport system permease subunit